MTQPDYLLTSTVHTTSTPKGRHLTTESAVTMYQRYVHSRYYRDGFLKFWKEC